MLEADCHVLEKHIVNFIRDSVYKNNFKNGIVGVSGGIDSAVVLALVQRALGPDHTFALLMPYKTSAAKSTEHGKLLCQTLNVAFETIDISPQIDAYFSQFTEAGNLLIGNKCARERMSILYDHSVRKQALVIGAANKSELLIGYSTIYGDNVAAFFPIGDLYKTQVYALAEHLAIPHEIISKPPSADLWQNQTDEDEIGIPYKDLDKILYQLIDLKCSEQELLQQGYSAPVIAKIKAMIVASQYKRTLPPIAKIHNRTIGIDFRYLRDWDK